MGTSNPSKIGHFLVNIALIIFVFVVIEALALVWLNLSVDTYSSYWDTKINEKGDFTYVALGDSAAQGIGATSPMKGYVGLIASSIEAKTGKKVRIVNLSKSGATIQDCLKDQIPAVKAFKPDLVTIEIGANDMKDFNQIKFQKDFSTLVAKLPPETYVSNMPYFNSRPSRKASALQASQIIKTTLDQDGRMYFVDLQTQTENHQSIFGFAPDFFHPNNLSYWNWHNAFWPVITSRTDFNKIK